MSAAFELGKEVGQAKELMRRLDAQTELEQYRSFVESLELIMFGDAKNRSRDELELQATLLKRRHDKLSGMEEDWKRYISRP